MFECYNLQSLIFGIYSNVFSFFLYYQSLKAQKDKLDTIQSVQGASLDELENQLKESQRIYGKMKQNLQGEILQNLISGKLFFKLFFEAKFRIAMLTYSFDFVFRPLLFFCQHRFYITNLGNLV